MIGYNFNIIFLGVELTVIQLVIFIGRFGGIVLEFFKIIMIILFIFEFSLVQILGFVVYKFLFSVGFILGFGFTWVLRLALEVVR